jgi:threonine dehydrogenase-like Zn-dependent dehydrogenase
MKALTWHGRKDVRVEEVPDPQIIDPTDAIVEVTASAICGSDLHIYHGFVSHMKKGDILGHEFAGRVIAVGKDVRRVKVGDRVVASFTISCGQCVYCRKGQFALCNKSNPNGKKLQELVGYQTAGLYGYSQLYGGFAGGQAEYVRVPFADVGALVLPDAVSEEMALFLSDIFPTGYMAAENCDIKPGQTVAVWGLGPVGQFAVRSAFMFGAQRVIGIDRFPERIALAQEAGAICIDYSRHSDLTELKDITDGFGPDACIDAVGMEAHGESLDAFVDEILQFSRIETDRSHALRQAIRGCRPGGILSIPGVYVGILDNFPLGIAFAKGLNFRMGQTHVQKYMPALLERIQNGDINPQFLITHRITLDDVPAAYAEFAKKRNGSIKYVISPQAAAGTVHVAAA